MKPAAEPMTVKTEVAQLSLSKKYCTHTHYSSSKTKDIDINYSGNGKVVNIFFIPALKKDLYDWAFPRGVAVV